MRNRYVLLADFPLIAIAAAGGFALRFDWRFYEERPEFLTYVILALLVKPVVFYFSGMYERVWRYASVNDLLAIVVAVSLASLGTAVGVTGFVFASKTFQFSRIVFLSDWLFTLVAIGGLRLSIRVFGESQGKAKPRPGQPKRVLVVGAGDAGAIVVRELQRNPQLALIPVGFLDDEPRKLGNRIHGVLVLGDIAELDDVIVRHRVDEVIVAMPSAPGTILRAVADACRRVGIRSKTIPGVFELLDGQVNIRRLREVEISDLLRRAPIRGETSAATYLAGRTVLVTGAGGSIGSELCRQVAAVKPAKLVLLGHGENSLFEAWVNLRGLFPDVPLDLVVADVRDRRRLVDIFQRLKPAVVFHAAAHKHVPLMEENPEEAITNNVIGTHNVVSAALAARTERLIMVSTDKAVAPSSVMGASKRISEAIVRDAAVRHGVAFVVVRFGNVLGSRGSVVPFFKQQIERGGPVTITHPEMTRFFMTIAEAVHLLLQAGGLSRGGELFVLDMGRPVPILQLAEDLIKLSGVDAGSIQIVFTGIRPGEKLEEKLWEDAAVVERTAHHEVMRIVEPDICPPDEIDEMLGALRKAAEAGDRLGIEAELARWIPSFVPMSASFRP